MHCSHALAVPGSIINMAIGEEGMIVNYPEKESYASIAKNN